MLSKTESKSSYFNLNSSASTTNIANNSKHHLRIETTSSSTNSVSKSSADHDADEHTENAVSVNSEPEVLFENESSKIEISMNNDQTNQDDQNMNRLRSPLSQSSPSQSQIENMSVSADDDSASISKQHTSTAVVSPMMNTKTSNDEQLNLDSETDDDEEDSQFDIIDGIMFLNFETEGQLKEFTRKDEKLRSKNSEPTVKKQANKKSSTNSRNTSIASTSNTTGTKRKSTTHDSITSTDVGPVLSSTSTNHNTDQDSAFVSSELDDYLSRKRNHKSVDNVENTIVNKTTRRKTRQLDEEDLYSPSNIKKSFANYDSDTSSINSQNTRKLTSNQTNKLSQSTTKSGKGRPKTKQPEYMLINQTIVDLKESNDYDNAYEKCVEQVWNTHQSNLSKTKDRFRPAYLHQQHVCSSVLKALHPNVLNNSSSKLADKRTPSTVSNVLFSSPVQDHNDQYNFTGDHFSTSSIAESDHRTHKSTITKGTTKITCEKAFVQPDQLLQTNERLAHSTKSEAVSTVSASTSISNLDLSNVLIKTETKSAVARSAIDDGDQSMSTNKNLLFKIDPEEDNCLPDLLKVKSESIDIDKTGCRKKGRTDYHEEGFDIARIISKHNSKRDIRLPARYHESIVGSQWILPDFEENKNRIVNTGNGKKQSIKSIKDKKSSARASIKTSQIPFSVNSSPMSCDSITSPPTHSYQSSATNYSSMKNANETFNDHATYNLEDLMTEDEDNGSLFMMNVNASIGDRTPVTKSLNSKISKASVNNQQMKLTKERTEKTSEYFKGLYRELYYANRPERFQYYMQRALKPRVNKPVVLKEANQTIENLKKQKKSLDSANNLLLCWNNKLKLDLRKIEQSNGNLDAKELIEIENQLKQYRTNVINKVDHHINSAQEPNFKSNVDDSNGLSSICTQQTPFVANSLPNGLSKLDPSNALMPFAKNSIAYWNNSASATSATNFNCQSNVAFLDNTSGVSRVMNLKPKKTIANQSARSNSSTHLMKNSPNMKTNGVTLTPSTHRNKATNSKSIRNASTANGASLTQAPKMNGNITIKNQMDNPKNFMHFVPTQPNNFLTLKITGNGLQIPYCAPTTEVVPLVNAQPPNQINHHHLPQIVPNHSLASNHTPFVASKFVNFNFLKPNEITNSHHNSNSLSIAESLTPSSNSSASSSSQANTTPLHGPHNSQSGLVRNYAKILPKFPPNNLVSSNNMVKMMTPVVPFIQNLQIIPTTHNLVISPIDSMNNMTTSTAALCQMRTTFCPPKPTASVIAIHQNGHDGTMTNQSGNSMKTQSSLRSMTNGDSVSRIFSSKNSSLAKMSKFDNTSSLTVQNGKEGR